MNKVLYKVTEECIACRACVEVASENFAMGNSGKAYVSKQPENYDLEKACDNAIEVCPVEAIEKIVLKTQVSDTEPILASSNVKVVLDKHPELKDVLIGISSRFKKILNPAMYNTLARFATFTDAAKVTSISVCEILHTLNDAIGTMDQLEKIAPDCIKITDKIDLIAQSDDLKWTESLERYIYNTDSMPEIIEKISTLKAQDNIVLISISEPIELYKTAKGLGLKINIEKGREYRVSIFNPLKEKKIENWEERRHTFEQLDVRTMQSDPFDRIVKKAYATEDNEGFILIQRFEPFPIINMLAEMGFEHISEIKLANEVWVYFHKTPVSTEDSKKKGNKTDVVIQSATPVAYPVIMRLLQSEVIRNSVNIKELKVWEETEKHLAWITSGKADISFSALITSAKLRNYDVKIPALFVWDNFVILTRYNANNFQDIMGHTIATPLFEEAPPAKITKYLIKASGLNPDDFKFTFGKPFGRPEQIYADFVSGKTDTAILREPEASYAIKIMQDRGETISILSYNKIWNEINPGFGSFPNAGIVFKGEFVRKNPELSAVFLKELKSAIDWVNQNRKEAAKLSFDMMRQPVDRVELFLERVNFAYVSGPELVEKVDNYFAVLSQQGIVESEIDEQFLDIFRS